MRLFPTHPESPREARDTRIVTSFIALVIVVCVIVLWVHFSWLLAGLTAAYMLLWLWFKLASAVQNVRLPEEKK